MAIILFTDFGFAGPYVGQLKSVLEQSCPDIQVIDLMHDAPICNPKASSYLLPAFTEHLPAGTVVLSVVDPGVGGCRRPVVIEAFDKYFVGPGNGLFGVLLQLDSSSKAYEIQSLDEGVSATFHGRDIFAPIAAKLAVQQNLDNELRELEKSSLPVLGPVDLAEVVYVDHFGNAMTGLRANTLAKTCKLSVKGELLTYANTFSDVAFGKPFWYANSSGLIEIAINCGRAIDYFAIDIGYTVDILK